jgi:hypothetical protein
LRYSASVSSIEAEPVEMTYAIRQASAKAAADTAVIVLAHNAFFINERRLHRADLHTRRIVAVQARARGVMRFYIRIFALVGSKMHGQRKYIIPADRASILRLFGANDGVLFSCGERSHT